MADTLPILDPFQRIVNVGWQSTRYWVWNPSSFANPDGLVGRHFVFPGGVITYPENNGDPTLDTETKLKNWVDSHLSWAFLGPAPTIPQPSRLRWAPGFAIGRYMIENPNVNAAQAQLIREDGEVIFTFSITRPVTKEKLTAGLAFDFVAANLA